MALNISDITPACERLDRAVHDAAVPLKNEASYQSALEALDFLLRDIGLDECHPLSDLTEGLLQSIMAYEAQHHPVPPAAPDMELRLLIKEYGLNKQAVAEAPDIE